MIKELKKWINKIKLKPSNLKCGIHNPLDKKSAEMTKKTFKDIFGLNENRIITFKSPTESETCKIIENSYRATNIAFIEEWRKFCFKKLAINY